MVQRIHHTVMNRIGWLAPASFTDKQLPGNKIPEAEKKDYASRVRTFGASGKRSKEQQAAARADAKKLQAKLPCRVIHRGLD